MQKGGRNDSTSAQINPDRDARDLKRLADLIEPEPEVDRDTLLYLVQDLEVSVMDSGTCGDVDVIVMDIVAKVRKACGEIE